MFYQELLQHWFFFKNLHRTQVLWENQFIKLSGQNKALIFQKWIKSGIYYVNDILDVNGKSHITNSYYKTTITVDFK